MNLLVPAALAFGLIIPIILLLYFMRPRRQERTIGSTMLWQQALQDLQASHPWQRLHITPLLILQLLAALVIVLILTRPAIFSSSPISGNTIIVLQASASMQATDVAPNRFEAAKNNIADFIGTLGSGDLLSIITMARTPQVLIAASQDKTLLTSALQRAHVTNQDADLEQALSLAASLAEGRANSQVLIIGDGHILPLDQPLSVTFPVHYLPVGSNASNTAILGLASRTVQGQLVAFAQVANFSRQQLAIPVELYADGRLVNVHTLTLAPGAIGAAQWTPLPQNARFLHARVVSQDALITDDDAWSIVGGSLHGKVLLVTRGNVYLEKALAVQNSFTPFVTTPDKYSGTGTYDLTIFDDFAPPTLPTGSVFFINPPNGSYLFGSSGQQTRVSQVTPGNDTLNLLNSVDLSSVHALHISHLIKPALWAQTIINSPETPLLIAGENNNRRVAALSFDLHQSDLPLTPPFVVLIHNLMNWFLPSPVPGDGQVSAGMPVTLQTWPGADQVTISSPDVQNFIVAPPFPAQPFDATNATGIYQVNQRVHGQILRGAFAVNLFNAAQSRLLPAPTLPILRSTLFTSGGNIISHQLREIWPWIAAFLLLILCVEWWFFSRSYRTQPHLAQRQAENSRSSRLSAQSNTLRSTNVSARLQRRWQQSVQLTRKRIQKAMKQTRIKLKR